MESAPPLATTARDAISGQRRPRPDSISSPGKDGAFSPPQVVVCGSMSTFNVMSRVAEALEQAGIRPALPVPDEDYGASELEDVWRIKCAASRAHMEKIRDPATKAVLVVNVDRDGEPDYVGPNAFAEVAIAFFEQRPVFLLQGIPADYEDELHAWQVRPLHGDLSALFGWLGSDDHETLESARATMYHPLVR